MSHEVVEVLKPMRKLSISSCPVLDEKNHIFLLINNPQNMPPESRKTIVPTNNLDKKINEEDKMEQTYPLLFKMEEKEIASRVFSFF